MSRGMCHCLAYLQCTVQSHASQRVKLHSVTEQTLAEQIEPLHAHTEVEIEVWDSFGGIRDLAWCVAMIEH